MPLELRKYNDAQQFADYQKASPIRTDPSGSSAGRLYVIKRDGRPENVSYDKITTRILRLCYGLNMSFIDPAQISWKVIQGIYAGVTTCQLDNLASETCAMMSTVHPDYGTLAARIFTNNLHKETEKVFSNVVENLYNHTHPKTGDHMPLVGETFYKNVLANKDALNSAILYDRDYSFSFFGLKTLERAYLLRINEKVAERPQHLIMRVAVALHGQNMEKILQTYNDMSMRYFIHATPTLFNAGTMRAGLSSCFLLTATSKDDSIENIYKLLSDCAIISKYSGGIGISIHDIRAKGSLIRSTNGKSEGIIPMLVMFDKSARYVTQSNKRPGSVAVYLEPWHAEIREFLKLKENAGAEEFRARSLFYGLWIPDLFMKKAKSDDPEYQKWALFCPNEAPGLADVYGDDFEALYEKYVREGRHRKLISARDLLYEIIESQIKTGGPYMCFKDAANRKNNQRHIGTLRGSNLCVEVVQYTSSEEVSTCNLGSIGLPSYIKYGKGGGKPSYDFQLLHDKVKVVTKNLDRVIDETHYPIEKARYSNMRHRPIGVGVSGLADTFSLMRYPFDSPEARSLNKVIFETIYHACVEASCELAEELGPYESYPGSEFSKGKFQWNLWEEEQGTPVVHSGLWNWDELRDKVLRHGMRNSLLTAPMPTASTSQIIGFNEAFEPYSSNIFKRETLSGEFQLVNRHLLNELCELGIWNEQIKDQIIARRGSVQGISEIPDDIQERYKTVWETSQRVIIDMAADRGPYVDQSQSMNIFMAEPNFKKLSALHMYTWSKGLKTGCYYLKSKAAAAPLQFSIGRSKKTLDNTVVRRTEPTEPSQIKLQITEKERADADDLIPVCRMEEGCVSCSG